MSTFDDDIISGSILKSVWKVAWPVVITQLVAGVHGLVDHILVGNHVGFAAQAGIGVSWQLFLVVLVFLSSLFHGMNIHIARYTGKRDSEAVNLVFFETFKASLYAFMLIVAPIGYILAPYLLDLINAEAKVQVYALPYLRMMFTMTLPLFIIFLLNGAFQSVGNPKIPLYFGILTTLVKILVSYLLITGVGPFLEMGVMGAAIGTCIGPLPSVFIAIYLVHKRKMIIGFPDKLSFVPDMSVIKPVLSLGIPAGIQAVLLNIGGVILLYYIGSLQFSAEAQAAYTICYSQLFNCVTWAGFGLRAACATVIGQNIGADKTERGIHGVNIGAIMGGAWAAFFGIFYWTMPVTLLSIFGLPTLGEQENLVAMMPVIEGLGQSGFMPNMYATTLIEHWQNEIKVVELGASILHFLSFSGIFVVVGLAYTGGLQGAGDTKAPMFAAFVSQILVLLGICFVYQRMDALTTTVIWSAILISHLARLVFVYYIFKRENWRNIKVAIGEDK